MKMLRRPGRRSKQNPLTGWEDHSGLTAATVEPVLVPLLKPGARENFERVFKSVETPIAFCFRPLSWEGDSAPRIIQYGLHTPEGRAAQPVKVRQYRGEEFILKALADYAQDVELARRLNSLLIVLIPNLRQKAQEVSPVVAQMRSRGSVDRISPYTPFVMLHRLGDRLRGDQSDPEAVRLNERVSRAEEELLETLIEAGVDVQEAEDIVETDIYSRGVDTAAGRMSVAGPDYMSDLFAKYLITGRLAYDPVNPPPKYPGEAKFRQTINRVAVPLFRRYVHILNRMSPGVIYDT